MRSIGAATTVLVVLVACGDGAAEATPPPSAAAEAPARTPAPDPRAAMVERDEPPAAPVTDDESPLPEGVPELGDTPCNEWARRACACSPAQCRMVRSHHRAMTLARRQNDVRQASQLLRVCEQSLEHFSCEGG